VIKRIATFVAPLVFLLLVSPTSAFAATDSNFKPVEEFIVTPWFNIEIGPVNVGISKAVVYLWLAAVITVVATLWIVRGGLRRANPGRTQAVVETIYSFAETNIGKATLPRVAFQRWFPYLFTLFLFIWILNLISFIPLPLDTHNHLVGDFPGLTIYAATSNISVTLTLTLLTIVISHVEGVRANGVSRYLASWVPPAPPALKPFLIVLEVLSQFLRIVSLSVRLFANMLAGHLLIIMCIGFVILLSNIWIFPLTITAATFFYVFELGLVASLQAYIFAMLSGIYIGTAIQAEH
jgi:F-type H+-transporting ATPase subunit a